eukprot:747384-Hanusia_phi.AAC.3
MSRALAAPVERGEASFVAHLSSPAQNSLKQAERRSPCLRVIGPRETLDKDLQGRLQFVG